MPKRQLSANSAEKILLLVLTAILIASLIILVKLDRRRHPTKDTPPGTTIVD